ncbi:MAG: alpha/beta hydrolase [Thermomicrobiales bacterium]
MTSDLSSGRAGRLSRRGLMLGAALASGAAAMTSTGIGFAAPRVAQDATPVPAAQPNDQMQAVLDELANLNQIPIESQSPFNARQLPLPSDAALSLLSARDEPAQEPVGDVDHRLIPTPNGDLVARIYTPQGSGPFPVLVYFHGGGWVIANLNTYDASCRALTNAANGVVVSVAYRQAPENPFPAAADDAYYAFQYVAANPTEFGGESGNVAIGGESAGGNLATVTCLLARDQGGIMPVHQLLVYPVTTFVPEGLGAETIQQFANAQPLSAPLLDYFGNLYVPTQAERQLPSASPLLAADLSGLPPATIIAAAIDPLVGQGRQYADALEAAGNDVTYTVYSGVTHEFFGLGALVDEAQEAVSEAAGRLTASFRGAIAATPTP